MTVKELVARLQKEDPDALVTVEHEWPRHDHVINAITHGWFFELLHYPDFAGNIRHDRGDIAYDEYKYEPRKGKKCVVLY